MQPVRNPSAKLTYEDFLKSPLFPGLEISLDKLFL